MINPDEKKVCDPVCHMMVDANSHAIKFQEHTYAFCSQQCRDRFNASPHLYIGTPGHPSPTQHGDKVIKKRTLKLGEPLTETQSEIIITNLKTMMGIIDVHIESDHIYITYDLLQATAEQIETTIDKTEKKLGRTLTEKLKRAFIHYLEDTELENLEHPGAEHHH